MKSLVTNVSDSMDNTDQLDEEDLQRLESVLQLTSTSTGTTVSSKLVSDDDVPAGSSSGDLSTSGGSLCDVPSLSEVEPVIPRLEEEPVVEPVSAAVVVREKCVGIRNRGVASGFTTLIGRRKEMEDAVAVVPDFMSITCGNVGGCTAPGSRTSCEISPLHFFGVYDGHGGSQVARFCAERMHEVVGEEWNGATVDGNDWQKKWEAVLCSSFERADSEVVKAGGEATEMIGSTAIVAVISACQIIVSNCGDSRAILCRGAETIPLSVDQKPDREDELRRIEADGGKVINWNGARVFGVLAMSRSIGDRYLSPWIISVPEVSFTTRTEEDECVILATDGLWDVMTKDEVAEVARRVLRRLRKAAASDEATTAAQSAAEALTEIAIGRNSSDNISIIVVDLKSKRKRVQKNPSLSESCKNEARS